MKESQDIKSKKEGKNNNENINLNIISQDDLININNINLDKKEEFYYNYNQNNNDINIKSKKKLHYNYLEEKEEEEDNTYNNNLNKSSLDIINKLKKENNELKNDMKKLYFLTQENKNNLLEQIQKLKDENFKLKNETKNLEYKLLIIEGKNAELLLDKEKEEKENKIIQQKYLNEIKELNCQLNNYKIKLNDVNLNYEQLLNDFHFIQNDKI